MTPARRVLIAVVLCLLTVVPATLVVTGGTASAVTSCSSRGLRLTDTEGGVSSTIKVVHLRQTSTTCAKAYSFARALTGRMLASEAPLEFRGYTISVKPPCDGCASLTHVFAQGPTGLSVIRYDVKGVA